MEVASVEMPDDLVYPEGSPAELAYWESRYRLALADGLRDPKAFADAALAKRSRFIKREAQERDTLE